MSISAAVGRRIRELRADAGMSPAQLAKESGLRATELLEIEQGHLRPSLGMLDRLAAGLNVTVAQLIQQTWRGPGGDVGTRGSLRTRLARIGRAIAELPDGVGNKLDAAEAAVVKHALMVCGGNKSAAARLIGVQRKAFTRRLDRMEREARR